MYNYKLKIVTTSLYVCTAALIIILDTCIGKTTHVYMLHKYKHTCTMIYVWL